MKDPTDNSKTRENLVSIVIPCHNAAKWLAESLESAFAQTWQSTEVILVDDGSSDDSLEIARAYLGHGLRIVCQSNKGAAAARNAGLAEARGKFIQFLDADDLLVRDKIEQQMLVLAQRSPFTLASGAWDRFWRDPNEASYSPHANWRDMSGVEFLQVHYEEGCMMHPAAWLASRALLDRAGPWNEALTLNDDGEYFARVMLAANGIVFCRKARSCYRSGTGNSLSSRTDRQALASLFNSVDLTLQYLLAADQSERSRAAAAYAWKWTAFELCLEAPDLSDLARNHSERLGGSTRKVPGGGALFEFVSALFGWRFARRIQRLRVRSAV